MRLTEPRCDGEPPSSSVALACQAPYRGRIMTSGDNAEKGAPKKRKTSGPKARRAASGSTPSSAATNEVAASRTTSTEISPFRWVVAIAALWAVGYAGGTWYAQRESDQRWTLQSLRSYVAARAETTSDSKLAVRCGEGGYVYSEQFAEPVASDNSIQPKAFARLSQTEATVLATTLGAGSLSQVEIMLEQFKSRPHWAAIILGGLVGVYVGYTHHVENTPSCERADLQRVVKEAGAKRGGVH